MHLKIHTTEKQLITASGVIHNLAFPRHTCCLCFHPQQPQRRAFVGGNPVQRVRDGTSSPTSPLSWEPACCLVWSWHSSMNCRRISNQLIPTPPPSMHRQVPLATCPSGIHSDLLGPSKFQGCGCQITVDSSSGERLRVRPVMPGGLLSWDCARSGGSGQDLWWSGTGAKQALGPHPSLFCVPPLSRASHVISASSAKTKTVISSCRDV